MIQNQHGAGKIAKKWDKTGLVLENLGYNKYRIKVDGSGRVTDRNRQYLRKFTPVTSSLPGPSPERHDIPEPVAEPAYQPVTIPEPVVQPQQPVVPDISVEPAAPTTPRSGQPPQIEPNSPSSPESPSFVTPPTTPVATGPPRRSSRISKPPERWGYEKF